MGAIPRIADANACKPASMRVVVLPATPSQRVVEALKNATFCNVRDLSSGKGAAAKTALP
jgi:hypothetical protein